MPHARGLTLLLGGNRLATALEHVVELNEGAKSIRQYAFEVSLTALGAIVRSKRGNLDLRGFNEVASQMRDWSRELDGAVQQITALAGTRVRLVSHYVRLSRTVALLDKASVQSTRGGHLGACRESEQQKLASLRSELRAVQRSLDDALESIAQLGLMASVLARAALIEAASAREPRQRRELSIVSQDFASFADQVNGAISELLARNRTQRA